MVAADTYLLCGKENKMTRFSLRLLESSSEISQKIIGALQQHLSGVINKAIPKITQEIKAIVGEALRQEPEYSSLLSGTLKAEFGISDSSSVEKIVQALCETININQQPIVATRLGLKGGFTLTMMKSDDMNGVIYLDSASVVDNNRGYALPWLDWLLYENNKPIVKNYSVKYTNSQYSRSGLAVMIPDSVNWRVPPEFAGSTRNNWTTRALSRIDTNIYKIISDNIKDKL